MYCKCANCNQVHIVRNENYDTSCGCGAKLVITPNDNGTPDIICMVKVDVILASPTEDSLLKAV